MNIDRYTGDICRYVSLDCTLWRHFYYSPFYLIRSLAIFRSMMELLLWIRKTYCSHIVTLTSTAILRESKLILAGPIFLYWWTSTNHNYYWLVFFPTPRARDTQTQSRQDLLKGFKVCDLSDWAPNLSYPEDDVWDGEHSPSYIFCWKHFCD